MEKTLSISGLEDIEIENTSIEEIDSEEVMLIFVGIDESGSMRDYKEDGTMEQCLKDFKDALLNSKEAEKILIVRANFASNYDIGGYKPISEFATDYESYGLTVLYDVIFEGSEKLLDYRQFLKNNGHRVKAVFAIFSDGINEGSKHHMRDALTCIKRLNAAEVITSFLCFSPNSENEAKDLEFRNILKVGTSPSELRRGFDCLSKSLIEVSQNVIDPDDFFNM